MVDTADVVDEGFSIGVLASRTGVTPAVLRTWENRFGFPAGMRSPAGHRRFTDADVRRVREVLEVRDSGVPLQLAIDAVARREADGAPESVHAVLVRDFPELRPQRLGRPALVAASALMTPGQLQSVPAGWFAQLSSWLLLSCTMLKITAPMIDAATTTTAAINAHSRTEAPDSSWRRRR